MALIVLVISLSLSNKTFAQTAVIPDANLRQHLINNYPAVMDNSEELIISVAQNFSDTLECINKNVVNISGLEHFTSIPALVFNNNNIVDVSLIQNLTQLQYINLNNNELEVVPDLSGFNSLKKFYANYNQLDNPPVFPTTIEEVYLGNNSLAGTYDISSFTQLNDLRLFENDIKRLPGLELLQGLNYLDLHGNDLNETQDLSALTSLTYLDLSDNNYGNLPSFPDNTYSFVGVSKNYLSFEDLVSFSSWVEFPNSFDDYKTQFTPDTSSNVNFYEGSNATIKLNFDHSVNTNLYKWYKGSSLIATTTENVLTIQGIDQQDSGVYYCEITNSSNGFAGMKVTTSIVTVAIDPAPPCFTISGIQYYLDTVKCENKAVVNVFANTSGIVVGDLVYSLVDGSGNYVTNESSIEVDRESEFTLKLSDDLCDVEWNQQIEVVFNTEECIPEEPLSFSPNGDGVDDTFYISEDGRIQIFNKRGVLVKENIGPFTWDGTNTQNELLDLGYYVIIIDGSKKIGVSLIR